ncbi:hypothetical protein ACPXCE_23835 [Streptomyces sp. DT24]|uniref:hypothetical protein n=1 Tax=Streptomyces sp. DT24 TaxID=3416520 RepID=UPI003CEAD9B0
MTHPEPERTARPVGSEPAPSERAVHIGSVSGSSFAIGDHNQVGTVNGASGADREAAVTELLSAVRELRADLSRLTARVADRGPVAVLDGELVSVQDEIESTDVVTPGRLARLRDALLSAGPVVELLASGSAVATSVAALLGA